MATEYEPRRAKPNERFQVADASGKLHTFSADEEGVIYPRNEIEAGVADSRALPVARKVQQRQKADAAGGEES